MSADELQNKATATDVATTETIVDQERSEKILKAKELYSQGSRNFLVKSYAESADELSQVCALYEELYGELSDELGMPYLLYAKSLIALALDENKVIDVPDEEDDDDDDEEDDNEEDVDAEVDGKNGEAAVKSTNGTTTAKLDTVKEVVESSSTTSVKEATAADSEADSTENSDEKMSTAEEELKSKKSEKEKSDEALVTSTENGANSEVLEKNGCSTTANGNSSKVVVAAADEEKPSTSNGDDIAAADDEDEENEVASSLQLAWEILELAAKIFSRQGLSGLANLAEVQTELANIEFENNILDAARDDYEKALKIYGELTSNYRRAMAEIHYKIGLTYLMQSLNKEGAESLKEACNLIEEEISEIKAKEDITEKDKNNIQDMEETKQEILAKIVEIEETQAQQIADVRAALDKVIKPVAVENADGAGPSSSSSSANSAAAGTSSSATAAISSSSTKPTDISHLIKRKKPEEPNSEAEAATASPAKRPAV